jgi:hypothetical protein
MTIDIVRYPGSAAFSPIRQLPIYDLASSHLPNFIDFSGSNLFTGITNGCQSDTYNVVLVGKLCASQIEYKHVCHWIIQNVGVPSFWQQFALRRIS